MNRALGLNSLWDVQPRVKPLLMVLRPPAADDFPSLAQVPEFRLAQFLPRSAMEPLNLAIRLRVVGPDPDVLQLKVANQFLEVLRPELVANACTRTVGPR